MFKEAGWFNILERVKYVVVVRMTKPGNTGVITWERRLRWLDHVSNIIRRLDRKRFPRYLVGWEQDGKWERSGPGLLGRKRFKSTSKI